MYRGYESDWSTPRPVRPFTLPMEPDLGGDDRLSPEDLTDPSHGPSHIRKPVPRFPPVRGRPMPPIGPIRPPGRPPVPIRLFPLLNAAMMGHDLLANAMRGDGGLTGFAGYTLRCNCEVPSPYPTGGRTTYSNTEDLSPWPCLTAQSLAGLSTVPLSDNRTIIRWYEPNPSLLPLVRGATHQIWTRPDSEPSPQNILNDFWPQVRPWEVPLPLVDGQTDMHLPWAVLPHRVTDMFPEASSWGNGLISPPLSEEALPMSTQTTWVVTGPQAEPVPQVSIGPYVPHPRDAFPPPTVERKTVIRSAVMAAYLAARNASTEANDAVKALFAALPKAVQADFHREWFRDHTWEQFRPAEYVEARAEFLWRHRNDIDIEAGVANLLVNEVTDRLWGRYFQARQDLFVNRGIRFDERSQVETSSINGPRKRVSRVRVRRKSRRINRRRRKLRHG